MNSTTLFNKRLLEKALTTRKENDWLVLDDDTLIAALDKTQPLTRNEWNALLDSPLTLRRLNVLIQQRRGKRSSHDTAEAANDSEWIFSEGYLLAADSGEELTTLTDKDHWWTLVFLKGPGSIRVVIKLDADAPIAREKHVEVALLDGSGRELLKGQLDDEGEMEGDWPLPDVPPYAHFQSTGGVFRVKYHINKPNQH